MVMSLLGGLGLFLLGMTAMTDGLKTAAGATLRRVLSRFTRSRAKALLSGVLVTTLVQSSSAAILTTIGFVSAGLIPFSQAVAVVMGAALGTTSTGWLVAVVGLKVSISALAFPLVGAGALVRVFGRPRTAAIGQAVAGFGLIFLGIDTLRQGMEGLAAAVDLSALSAATLSGRTLLAAGGVAMTVIMQSSSAAVATTLTALHAGTIGLPEAGALVVGQNLGTSVTAALATIGAAVPARRTALFHVGFNTISSAAAFILLSGLLHISEAAAESLMAEGAVALAIFHTLFNGLGVAVVLPVLGRFASVIERLIPQPGSGLSRHLDPSVAQLPEVAVESARRTVRDTAAVVLEVARRQISAANAPPPGTELDEAAGAVAEVRRFLGLIRTDPNQPEEYRRHLSLLHAVDHLDRLHEACREAHPASLAVGSASLGGPRGELKAGLDRVLEWLNNPSAEAITDLVHRVSQSLAASRRRHRTLTLARTASGAWEPGEAGELLDAMRWLDRLGYHSWRLVHHLAGESPLVDRSEGEHSGADEGLSATADWNKDRRDDRD